MVMIIVVDDDRCRYLLYDIVIDVDDRFVSREDLVIFLRYFCKC